MTEQSSRTIDEYNIREAHDFYRKHIYNIQHQKLLLEHGFTVAGSVASINWELFAAILTGDKGKGGYGSDLTHYEVKSSVEGNGFEYQYHLNGGKKKLMDDMVVDHIFVSYSPDYRDIEVRTISGQILKPVFTTWLPGLVENYEGSTPKQRYRKSISFGFVKTNGKMIYQSSNGTLVHKRL